MKLLLPLLLLLTACVSSAPPREPFARQSETDIAALVGDIHAPSGRAWEGYVFDIQVTANGYVVPQFDDTNRPRQKVVGSHMLTYASSIGTRDGVKNVSAYASLWPEQTLGKERATAAINLDLVPEKEGFAPDMRKGGLRARIVCNDWAQALATKQGKAPDYHKLKHAFDSNWQKERVVKASFALAPYKRGVYWVIPVEVELPSATFESNCLTN